MNSRINLYRELSRIFKGRVTPWVLMGYILKNNPMNRIQAKELTQFYNL